MKRPASIRGRILLALVLVMAVNLAGSAFVTAWALNSYLEGRLEHRLENVRDQVQQALAVNVANQGGLEVREAQLELLFGDSTGLILVVDGEPGLVVDLPDVPAERLIEEATASPAEVLFLEGDHPAATIAVPSRGLSVILEGVAEPVAVDAIVLAVSREDDQQTVARLIRIGVLVGLVALALFAALSALVLRAGLRPLTDLAGAVQAVGAGEREPEAIPMRGSTETAKVAKAARDAFTARARAEDRLRTFVADASHELRTPLTKIGGWADLYLQGGIRTEAATQTAMEKVEAEAGRMGLLVEELSLLARLDAQVPLDLVDLDLPALRQLAAEVLEDARVVTADRSFTLHPSTGQAVVRGDAERLRRVLRNLVGNAVQHTPAGTSVEVQISVEDGSTVAIAVRDHGLGIPADQVPKLFERFWRAEESRTRAKGGSGLGLAIVEAVVVAHGGSVAVESDCEEGPDQGTTVTLRLPVQDNQT